jgi:phosphohistidine swiveling domain-containing protein
MHNSGVDFKDLLTESIINGRKRYEVTSRICLPPLISQIEDVWQFHIPNSEPNFITQKSVTAVVTQDTQKHLLAGAIIAISNADPGFDWLFSYPIAGLITAYGGANSHMAIRAGELGLPAVIGAGEDLFRKWSSAQRLNIDCAIKRVEILS